MLDLLKAASCAMACAVSPRQEDGRGVDCVQGREFYSDLPPYCLVTAPYQPPEIPLTLEDTKPANRGLGSLSAFAILWEPW